MISLHPPSSHPASAVPTFANNVQQYLLVLSLRESRWQIADVEGDVSAVRVFQLFQVKTRHLGPS